MSDSPFSPGSLVCGLIRDSGGATQELSAEQQEFVLRQWCLDNQVTLTHTFVDAVSGRSTKGRDEFLQMITYFQSEPPPPEAGLIYWRCDRFARNVPDAQYYRSDLRRRGFIVYSVQDNIPQGTFMYAIEALEDTLAQRRSEKLSEDVQRGLHRNIGNYHTLGGFPPKGFIRQPIEISRHRDGKPHMSSKWVPDPELAPTIQRAWAMRAAGASYGEIKKATSLYRSINSFTTFFRNRLYIGELVFGETIIPEYCPPIIDRETWDAVQELNKKNKGNNRPPRQRKTYTAYILSGLLICGHCGSPLSGTRIRSRDRKIYPYYRCTQRNRNRDCQAHSIPQAAFEAQVLDLIKNQLLSPENITNALQTDAETRSTMATTLDSEISALKKQRQPLQRKINRIVKAITDAGHSQALLSELAILEHQDNELHAQITLLEAQIPPPRDVPALPPGEISARLIAALEAATPAQKRIILNGFITSITVTRTGKKVHGTIHYTPPPVLSPAEGPALESPKEKPPDGGESRLAYTSHRRGGMKKEPTNGGFFFHISARS